jgi:hypothetical protein
VYYAELAAAYVELIGEGVEHPVTVLAKRLEYDSKTISNALLEARRRGLLTRPPMPGRAGGELTPKALALLKEDVQ